MAFKTLPDLEGKLIYDLGCAHGDHSQRLSELGATVYGIDGNSDLLQFAKQRKIERAQFRLEDLGNLPAELVKADGIWSSFVAAYFTDLDFLFCSSLKLFLELRGH